MLAAFALVAALGAIAPATSSQAGTKSAHSAHRKPAAEHPKTDTRKAATPRGSKTAPVDKTSHSPKAGHGRKASALSTHHHASRRGGGGSITTMHVEKIMRHAKVEADAAGATEEAPLAFRHGCSAVHETHDAFLAAVGVRATELAGALDRDLPAVLPAPTGCVPYAAALGEDGRVQAFGVIIPEESGARRLYLYTRRSDNDNLELRVDSLASEQDFNIFTAPLGDVLARAPMLYTALPPEVLMPLAAIAPLLGNVGSSAGYAVRVGYAAGTSGHPARLLTVQLLADEQHGEVAGEALWIERPGLPGGFFAPDGRSYEHALWTSPVNFTRISRGVGSYRTTVVHTYRRRVGHHVRTLHARQVHAGTHVGVDFAAPLGTPVVAVADGRVVEIGRHGGYGNLIVVQHAGGYTTRYAHLSAFAPELYLGSEVRRGLEIGYVGSTGHSTGPHLHFEIRLDGVYLDPMDDRLAFGLWSMRPTDYVSMLRQTLIAESLAPATDLVAGAAGAPDQGYARSIPAARSLAQGLFGAPAGGGAAP